MTKQSQKSAHWTKTVTLHPLDAKGKAGHGLTLKLIDLDVLSGGAGGWQVVDRLKAKQGTVWKGTPAQVYTLPLRLDGMKRTGHHESVQAEFNRLWAMGRPTGGTAKKIGDPPTQLRCTGNVKTRAATRWVITNITENAQVRNDRGALVQYDVTVELTEFVRNTKSPAQRAADKRAAAKKAAAKRAAAAKAKEKK